MNPSISKGTVSMKKNLILTGVFTVVLISLLILVYYFFIPSNKVIVAYPGKVTTLVIEGNVVDSPNPPMFEDNQVLLPLDIIKKYFDESILWDEKLKKVIITTDDKVIRMNTDNLTAHINNKPTKLSVSAKDISGTVYMPIDFLEDVYRIDVNFNKDSNIVIIDYRNKIKKLAEVIQDETAVRQDMSIRSPIVKMIKKGKTLWAFDEYEKWYKVRTEDGIVGYIQKKYVKITSITSSIYTEETGEPDNDMLRGKLNVVWDPLHVKTLEMGGPPKIEGLDVISPTWFELAGDDGTVTSRADLRYVEQAKKNGYKVWALFRNGFALEDRLKTSKVLNDSLLREEVIKKILVYAKLYKLDGINVDFENMYEKDKDMFSQFIRELAPLLREQGLVVSVDVGVPGGSEYYSLCYDRKALAKAADYIMVMTYDQHWSSSPESGSVAQYTWVEKKLQQTLKEVPPGKLLLGIPFYTREWKEINGKLVDKPTVLSMDEAKRRVESNNAKVRWDQESGQFYAEYSKDGATFKIWIEDEKSINLKSSLAHKYNLAGVASWRKGFESKGVWAVMNTNLKKNINYLEWAQNNNNVQYKFR